jgi:acyl-CoA thioesterase I
MTAHTWSALLVLAWMAAAPAALAQKIDILALGASNTYGKGVSRGQSYPAHLQRQLRSRGINARVRNAGINGNTTGQMLARLSSVLRRNTRIVILQPGGNDRRRGISRQTRRGNVRAIKRRLRAAGIKVVMLRNRLIGDVARSGHQRPDGQHFLGRGYQALARRLMPQVLAALGRQ